MGEMIYTQEELNVHRCVPGWITSAGVHMRLAKKGDLYECECGQVWVCTRAKWPAAADEQEAELPTWAKVRWYHFRAQNRLAWYRQRVAKEMAQTPQAEL